MPDFMYHLPTDTEPVTVSLETNRFTCLSKTDYRTHRWHFIKCRSNIIEMSEHKTQAASMAPRNRIEIITLVTQLGLTIWEIASCSSWKKVRYLQKQHAGNPVDTTTFKASFIHSRVSPVLLNTNTTGSGALSWSAWKFHRCNRTELCQGQMHWT